MNIYSSLFVILGIITGQMIACILRKRRNNLHKKKIDELLKLRKTMLQEFLINLGEEIK